MVRPHLTPWGSPISRTPTVVHERPPLTPEDVRRIQRMRRHPRPYQFDYLHLRRCVDHLAVALAELPPDTRDVLDVFCGSRPFDDLLPPNARSTGLDVDDHYGVADVVSDEFLPFPDESFDAVMSIQAFHYVADQQKGIAELHRVLRPGGRVILTIPLTWGYDRTVLEHRYTGPELLAAFDGWEDVRVVEDGGSAVSWTFLTGCILNTAEQTAKGRVGPIYPALRVAFRASYLLLNAIGWAIDRAEQPYADRAFTLPPNLLLTARRPAAG